MSAVRMLRCMVVGIMVFGVSTEAEAFFAARRQQRQQQRDAQQAAQQKFQEQDARLRKLEQQQNVLPCATEETCKNSPTCQCYCSVVAHYRDKDKTDKPVVKDGICYCKQWDADNAPGPKARPKRRSRNKAKASNMTNSSTALASVVVD